MISFWLFCDGRFDEQQDDAHVCNFLESLSSAGGVCLAFGLALLAHLTEVKETAQAGSMRDMKRAPTAILMQLVCKASLGPPVASTPKEWGRG